MFALGAAEKAHGELPEDNEPFMELGKQLTATCHETYKRSPSGISPSTLLLLLRVPPWLLQEPHRTMLVKGIGPEIFRFNGPSDFTSHQKAYLLRPGFLLPASSRRATSLIFVSSCSRNRGELLHPLAADSRPALS